LYRVRSFQINLPALCDRIEDIADLAAYHVTKISKKYHSSTPQISLELLEMLRAYPWPGNVRELVNTLERIIAVAGNEPILFPQHVPENIRIQVARTLISRSSSKKEIPEHSGNQRNAYLKWDVFRKEAIASAERRYLQNLLEASGSKIKEAQALSGLSRSRLYEMLKKHRMTFPS
jgi:two-component system, NtrC family, response regulator